MTCDHKTTPKELSSPVSAPIPPEGRSSVWLRTLLVPSGLLVVVLIALLDYDTGPYLSCSIFYLIPVAACAWWGGFPHGILLAVAGSFAWALVDLFENPSIPIGAGVWNSVVRFGTLTLASSLVSRLHAGLRRERRLARSDPLTGAANARTFYEVTAVEAERARRTGRPLTLAYLDVDNFKHLNDRLGHAAGDDALLHIVQVIHRSTRKSDLLARLGGDEFALLLPEIVSEGAVALLVRLQQLLSEEMARKGWPVTLSVGAVTFLQPHDDVDRMIQQVDALMYGAKRKGKGRVEHKVEQNGLAKQTEDQRLQERRATARLLCDRTARVHRAEGMEGRREEEEEFATVQDISVEGVRLSMSRRLLADTLVVVEPVAPGPRTLLAKVVYSVPDEGGWKHGCKLTTCLSAEELGVWLGFGLTIPSTVPDSESAKHLAPGVDYPLPEVGG